MRGPHEKPTRLQSIMVDYNKKYAEGNSVNTIIHPGKLNPGKGDL